MRTYNITFTENGTRSRFNYKTTREDFRRMRTFILRAQNGLEQTFTSRLVDVCDDIMDMQEGERMYVISAKWDVYTAKNLAKFNDVVEMMDRASKSELGDKYQPNEFTAFVVKRTAKMWQFATLNAELN